MNCLWGGGDRLVLAGASLPMLQLHKTGGVWLWVLALLKSCIL